MINLLSDIKTRVRILHYLIIVIVSVVCFLFAPTGLQAGDGDSYFLSVIPSNQNVGASSGSTSFSVSTGAGTTTWTAKVISGSDWLFIRSGSWQINCDYGTNYSTIGRTGIIQVTAPGAIGSPAEVTVTQAPAHTPNPTPIPTPILTPTTLSVNPTALAVGMDGNYVWIGVANTGSGTLNWTAQVTSGGDWLWIHSGVSGTNSGGVIAGYLSNSSVTARTGTIRITASGASGSPVDVIISQVGHLPLTIRVPDTGQTECYNTVTVVQALTSTPASTAIPGAVIVNPTSGFWTSAGHTISVSSDNASVIEYAYNTTTDGSDPAAPSDPSTPLNPFFPSSEIRGAIGGASGNYSVPSSTGMITKVKIKFCGKNATGYGSNTQVYSYAIDLQTPTPNPTPTPGGCNDLSCLFQGGHCVNGVCVTPTPTPTPTSGNVIPCPSPGQALYGQDGNYSINPMSYTKLDAYGNDLPDSATTWYMVRDNVTRLIWEMKSNLDGVKNYNNPHDADNTYTWYNSASLQDPGVPGTNTDTQDFIDMLNYIRFGGYSDWRLPTAHELISIYSIKEDNPTINTTFFPNTMSKHYWSATDTPGFDNEAYAIIYDWTWSYGGISPYGFDKGTPYYARAVRGIGPTNQFITNGNNTVYDATTQLLWQKTPLFIGTTNKNVWDQALNYCETLTLDNYTDWRLPTIRELFSIVDYSRDKNSSKIDCNFFPDCLSDFFYSSTYYDTPYTHDAMGLLMIWGVQGLYMNSSNSYCRCVRGGYLTGSTFGDSTGLIQTSIPAEQELNLHINSSNSRGDTPVYQWLIYTYIINGAQSPLYLMSDRGIYELTNDVLTYLSYYPFTFDKDNVTSISSLSMANMGLKAGDYFVYAYAYMNAAGNIFIDNVVSIYVY